MAMIATSSYNCSWFNHKVVRVLNLGAVRQQDVDRKMFDVERHDRIGVAGDGGCHDVSVDLGGLMRRVHRH